ncbi:MAG: class I SAM-dependent methyltransferase [Steroidobacteraceae bacterium]
MPAELSQPSDFALRYEALMGCWSRALALRFVPWLSALPRQRWLDVGCGTGALTRAILEHAAPGAVWGVDAEPEYVRQARYAERDDRCRFLVADAARLPEEIENFDLTVSGLFLNLIPDPAAALAEMIRVTREGGRIAAYVWDFARGMQLARYFWDAAIELDRSAAPLDQGQRYPLCHPDRLHALFVAAGLNAIEPEPLRIPTVFQSFDDYWKPIEVGHGRASEYFETLTPQNRERLRERLRSMLPTRPDGSIPLTALAWAIVARRGT